MRTLGKLSYAAFAAAGLGVAIPCWGARQEEKLDFNRDVRPVLSKCFVCHGNDPGSLMAGLKLNTQAGSRTKLESGHTAIVPGKPEESEAVKRITSTDSSTIMPPEYSKKTLTKDEQAILIRWIKEGAEYKEHWAFVPVVQPTPPEVNNRAAVRNPIDRFILHSLEKAGLTPAPEADKRSLIRRATLDITGLPPAKAEIDAFLADKSPKAYERLLDRLLASPRYGERMAQDWLDGARYADSNGYQADYERFQWRWRDWVINAYNKNMPFDRFTVEQLAGDLLPNPTLDQRIATGFNRNHRINTEGGVIAEEWRVETVVDRVETTSNVWLGLTAGCARCHDHKYDPISQKEFYQLYAYFNNVPESGTGEERPVNHPPIMKAPTPDQEAAFAQAKSNLAKLDANVEQMLTANEGKTKDWKLPEEKPAPTNGLTKHVVMQPDKVQLGGKPEFGPGRSTGSVATNNDNFVQTDGCDVERGQAFSYGLWTKPQGPGAIVARMDNGKDFRGWDIFLDDNRPMVHLINKWPENSLKIVSEEQIPKGQWSHVFVTYDGSSKSTGMKLYINGKPVKFRAETDSLSGSIRNSVPVTFGRRTTGNFHMGEVDDFYFYNRVLSPEEVAGLADVHPARGLLRIPEPKRTPEEKKVIARAWLMDHNPKFAALSKQQAEAKDRYEGIAKEIPDMMVMEEMPKPRECFLLERGQYDKHGEKVEAALPAAFPKLPKGEPNNRLGLAKWIANADNPLTARVAVNRLWEKLFGTGIVATTEDFGTRAEFPSHPDLLEWLAAEYPRRKWDTKAMIKLMMMSGTYRQDSRLTPEKLARDPQNRLLSRGPRYRLNAEVIRDQALYVAGLLVEKQGGPSVRPYMPDGIWDETNVYGNLRNYKSDTNGNQYRRSLYTIWKRTAAPPGMMLFDAPSRETCRVRRARTNTPLQALVLMNDPTYVEAARVFAERMLTEGGKTEESRISFGFELALGRPASSSEVKVLSASIAKRIALFQADPKAARDLLFIGDKPRNRGLDQATLAAYAIAASTILNLDEAITKE